MTAEQFTQWLAAMKAAGLACIGALVSEARLLGPMNPMTEGK